MMRIRVRFRLPPCLLSIFLGLIVPLFFPAWASAQITVTDEFKAKEAQNAGQQSAVVPNVRSSTGIHGKTLLNLVTLPEGRMGSNSVGLAPRFSHTHPFWDRINKSETVAMFGLEAFDMAQTCNNLAHGGREHFNSFQSCPKEVAYTLGIRVGAILAAYALHETRHHKLERMPMLYMTGTSVNGIAYSKEHGAW